MTDALAQAQAAVAAMLASEPASPVLTLQAVKLNLKVEIDEDDSLIEDLITAAQGMVEKLSGHVLSPRTIVQSVDRFDGYIDLLGWPITGVASVKYTDPAGVQQSVAAGDFIYSLARRPVRLLAGLGKCWPRAATMPGAITVTFEAGYASPDDVPAELKRAMHLLIASWYRSRAGEDDVPPGVSALCRPFRRARV